MESREGLRWKKIAWFLAHHFPLLFYLFIHLYICLWFAFPYYLFKSYEIAISEIQKSFKC